MPNLTNLSHFSLKIIFAIHLLLVSWGMQGTWCPKSVLFYNLLFFVCIFWAVHNVESDEPLQFVNGSEKFSAAVMVINLIVRPISSIYLLRIGQERNGNLATVFAPSPAMGYGRQEYEEISHPVPQNSDFEGV
ncbi:hypothetical protein ALC56_12245 [Trachymyrmex septentrionalis]|uniref:Type-1 angiotensin II receptor-associated protein n=1 Tax=Trachymyrmex septentrionalis TaxID=34720 RepID=A0A195EZ88_9HYME|nr:hypothetical protein ALC56_12245 [Trachymyrmex septentrionalis]